MSSDDKTQIASSPAVGPGTQLHGIYEIDERIASGGMGEVYRGHNVETNDTVAIKIILPEFARDKTIVALFRKEASILNHLSHEAIVRYYLFAIEPTIRLPYLVMEFVDGESLADHIKRGPMDPQIARQLISRIASGLAAAHAAGIIHRDLSPDNIILPGTNVSKAKIIDFGIAKSATVGGGTLLGGKFAGKYNFVSPEQLGDFGGEVTAQSDIYSLGLVLAAILRGAPLDMGGSQVDVIEKRRAVPDVSALDPSLQPILQTMLQPDPKNRPPTMEAVAQWLSAPAQTAYIPGMPPPYQGDGTSYVPQASGLTPASGEGGSIPPQGGSLPGGVGVSGSGIGSLPPVQSGSQPPVSTGSQPPISTPEASPAAYGGSVAPVGQGLWQAPTQGSLGPQGLQSQPIQVLSGSAAPQSAPARQRTSRAAIYAAAVVLLAAGGAGAYFSGALNGVIGATQQQEASGPPTLEPTVQEQVTAEEPRDEPERPETEDVAVAKPEPPTVPNATDTLYSAATQVAWLQDYGGGSCFYATATTASDKGIEIEGFGTSAAAFDTLFARFKAAHSVEPQIGVRLIEEEQCAVADFLHALRGTAEDRPVLSLNQDVIKTGDPIRGALENLDGRSTDILLVDNEGVVYNLAQWLKKSGDTASFNIALKGLETADPVPQMIVAIASKGGLDAAKVQEPVLAATLFPKMLDEIRSKNIDASVTAKYFRLGG